jgi:biopolymer transport protein ExbB/TolQ
MMEQIGYAVLFTFQGLMIAILVYLAAWYPKERGKGHAGRKCKCCVKI